MRKEKSENGIVVLTIFLFFVLLYFCVNMFDLLKLKTVQAVSSEGNITEVPMVLNNKNPIDIDEIIEENRNIATREEIIYQEEDLEYTTQYINNEDLPSGTICVSQIGINGIQDIITLKKYNGNELISEQIVSSNIKKASVNKIVEIGTGKRKK